MKPVKFSANAKAVKPVKYASDDWDYPMPDYSKPKKSGGKGKKKGKKKAPSGGNS